MLVKRPHSRGVEGRFCWSTEGLSKQDRIGPQPVSDTLARNCGALESRRSVRYHHWRKGAWSSLPRPAHHHHSALCPVVPGPRPGVVLGPRRMLVSARRCRCYSTMCVTVLGAHWSLGHTPEKTRGPSLLGIKHHRRMAGAGDLGPSGP